MSRMAARTVPPMPSYEAHDASARPGATSNRCLLAAVLLIAFSLLDRALVPHAFLPLLGVRFAAALCLLACARLAAEKNPVLVMAAAGGLLASPPGSCPPATRGAAPPAPFSV